MRTVDFALRQYLERYGLSASRLAEAARGRLSRGTVYALARGSIQRLDLTTLGTVMTVLEELTGQEVMPGDLLTASTIPEAALEAKRETQEWEAADLLPDLPPYRWGPAAEPRGEPVRYVAGVGFVAGEA